MGLLEWLGCLLQGPTLELTAEQRAYVAATYTPEQIVATLLGSPSLTLLFVYPGYINHLPVLQCIQRGWRKLRALWRDPVQRAVAVEQGHGARFKEQAHHAVMTAVHDGVLQGRGGGAMVAAARREFETATGRPAADSRASTRARSASAQRRPPPASSAIA